MENEKRRLIRSFYFPALFVLLLWIIKGFEVITGIDLSPYGLMPLKARGLLGIVTCPLLHEDWSHLFANSVPLFVLGGLLFYFYKDIAWTIIILLWLVTGLWVWVFARTGGVHIGASGVVYGLAAFLFFSGIFRRETTLLAITLLVTFLYGGMVWGIFSEFFPQKRISWESHLMGGVCGIILAFFYKDKGPEKKRYSWEEGEEDDDEEETREPGETPPGSQPFGNYPHGDQSNMT